MVTWLLVATLANPWPWVAGPTQGPAEPIGSYSAGCLQGAKPLPTQGYYQLLRPQQQRRYGHPMLVSYLQDLTRRSQVQGLPPLLIGDMAMARGGPFTSGHRSHQNGLDVDIWFRFAKPRLSNAALREPTPLDMVSTNNRQVSRAFTAEHITLLKLAATDSRVERIFVHPAIKLALCQKVRGDRSWLKHIRPWFGHRAHLHVRLICPAKAVDCKPQKPLPPGEGCGSELMSWFDGPTEVSRKSRPAPLPELPARCEQILHQGKSH
ncbi:MAG: penicillin-insensitive murein endopeptidase [Aeromonadaceae bacterium]